MNSSPTHFLNAYRSVHLVGIGGAGVSALARLFYQYGLRVSGSDTLNFSDEASLRALGIHITIGHSPLPEGVDALVYSPAVPQDDPERIEARARGIHEFSYPEALGELMGEYYGIAVSGTNGKTTTTALLGLMLQEAEMNPTVVVGGMIPAWSGNMRIGSGVELVVEGCEYRRHMLNLKPQMIVLTNIAEDHLDYYRNLDDIKDAFGEYIRKLPLDGVVVYNADDPDTVDVVSRSAATHTVSFSLVGDADYVGTNAHISNEQQQFVVQHRGTVLGTIITPLPGAFNRSNILAAVAAAHTRGASFDAIARAVAIFSGVARRFERIGVYHGAPVVLDYAHHPDAVLGTIAAARELFLDRRIVAVFQPHQTDRTIKLFDGFVEALLSADTAVVAEIYRVLGREENSEYAKISSRLLVDAINERADNPAVYAHTLAEAEAIISSMDVSKSAILIMGAGDIDTLARKLVVS